jgi:hypothetical protein
MAHTRDISTITLYIILGILATILLLPLCIRGIYNFKLYSIKRNIIRGKDSPKNKYYILRTEGCSV